MIYMAALNLICAILGFVFSFASYRRGWSRMGHIGLILGAGNLGSTIGLVVRVFTQ